MPDAPRRIAITGSAGFLGEASVDRLTSLDTTEIVAAIDLMPTQGPPGETRPFISMIRDVRLPLDDVFKELGIDSVLHLAFLIRPHRDAAYANAVNVGATEQLLKSCVNAGVSQFIYLSSTTVYGAHSDFSRPFTEADAPRPVSGFVYSHHKVEVERLIDRFAEENPDKAVCNLRGCIMMGPGASNFISDALNKRYLPVPMGANPEMQFLHIDDYASALETVMVERARGLYNLAGDGTITWRELVSQSGATLIPAPAPLLGGLIGLTWAARIQGQSNSSGLNFIRHPYLASNEKIKKELGWTPQHSSRETIDAWNTWRNSRAE